MTTVFKGWGGAWGDSWGPVAHDPNAMYGSAALSFSAAGVLSGLGSTPGEMIGAAVMVFSAQATATSKTTAKPRTSSYSRTGKQHGRRWRLPERTHTRTRHERERDDLVALFGR